MKLEKLSGTVVKVFYSSGKFTAGMMRTTDRGKVKFSTRLPISEGESISGLGYVHIDPKWGEEFRFQSFSDHEGNVDADGLAYYLSHHPKLAGVGKKKAEELATKYVDVLLTSLDSPAADLAKKLSLPIETIEILQKEFAGSKSPKTIARLCSYGISPRQATEIVQKWGADALHVIEHDPFRLIGTIPGFAFKKTDDVARAVGFPKTHPSRIEAGILYVLQEAEDDGHTYYERIKLIDASIEILFLDHLDSRKMVDEAIGVLCERKELIKFFAGKGDEERIQLMEMNKAEILTAKRLIDFNANKRETASLTLKNLPETLNEKQLIALKAAVRHGISVVCGAAGTGKTFTIRTIYEALRDLGEDLAICAPTGKAAKRVTQLTGYEAKTIHRLLEHNGKSFQRHAANKLDENFVIVDESSMIDSVLMAALLEAMPTESSLVLVGDPNQLPPVGPGCPFMDIIASGKFPVTVLDQVMRHDGPLKVNCSLILEGKIAPSSPPAWYTINTLDTQEDVRAYLIKMYTEMIAHKKIFDSRNLPIVLSPQHKGVIGTKELNAVLQEIVHREVLNVVKFDTTRAGRIMLGDRVIQTKNDYDLHVMNGNTGTVVGKDAKGLSILFDDEPEPTEVPNDSLGNLQLAYVLTVHKAQGSEFRDVIFLIHKGHSFMHDRSLIYTGATRASKNLYILGDAWSQRTAAKTVKNTTRRTLLRHLLINSRIEIQTGNAG